MKTILWKELRENARWVPLGIIPMIIVLVLKWRSNELIFDASEYGSSLSLSSLVGLVAGGIAVCLGLIQSWPDQRPAARALLLHRGITADAAFCGKLLAGLLLYATAVFVPLLGMAAFITSVGIEHRAASPGALLPAALISVAAFSCWPASLLIVQRDARFWGSRLLPGLTAALAVFACGATMHEVLWLAITIAVVTLVAFLAAARSVFVNSSHIATGNGRAYIAIAVTVALLTLMMCAMSMIESYRTQVAHSGGEAVSRQYVVEFGPDGRPWLTRTSYTWSSGMNKLDQVAKMVPHRSVRDQLQPVEDSWEPLRKWSPYRHEYYNPKSLLGGRFARLNQATIFLDSNDALNRTWVFDAKRDAVLVYRSEWRTRFRLEAILLPPASVGSFGQVQNPGSVDAAGNFTLVSSTGVYRVPGSGAEVETIYAVPQASSFLGSATISFTTAQALPRGYLIGLMVRLSERVVLLNSGSDADAASRPEALGAFSGLGEVFATEVHLPNELATADRISISRDPTIADSYVGLVEDWGRSDLGGSWFRFDKEGRIEEQDRYEESPVSAVASGNIAAVASIPPAFLAFGVALVAIENRSGNGIREAWEYTKTYPAHTALIVFLGMLQPTIGIPLAFWAARRRRLDKRATRRWICWAFWFGPCGSLALLAVYPRLIREPCNVCQRPARIDLASCEHCGHSLDETPQTGIEIFDQGQGGGSTGGSSTSPDVNVGPSVGYAGKGP
ncbi:MAG: hypothetical protein O3C40_09480 [Planctomycetota bacterium]|nr:hypothetical protein [Planctomycetota bacterium]